MKPKLRPKAPKSKAIKSKVLSFSELKRLWYNKLKATGFKDIEKTINGADVLVTYDATWFKARGTPDVVGAQTEYYKLARDLLHTFAFESKRDKFIWELHSEGKSCRETQAITKVHKDIVNRIVRKISRAAWNK